jgi:hypothetical protein
MPYFWGFHLFDLVASNREQRRKRIATLIEQ